MIQSWTGKEAQAIFEGRQVKGVAGDIARRAKHRLDLLSAADGVEDLRLPPSNRLHKIGQAWSISVNMQFRITFIWGPAGPEQVWFGDYH